MVLDMSVEELNGAGNKTKFQKFQVSFVMLRENWCCYQRVKVKILGCNTLSGVIASNSHKPCFLNTINSVLFNTANSVFNYEPAPSDPWRGHRTPLLIVAIISFVSFLEKVENNMALISSPSYDLSTLVPCLAMFHHFELISLPSLEQLVYSMKPSGSPLDIVPPGFLKEDFLLPILAPPSTPSLTVAKLLV